MASYYGLRETGLLTSKIKPYAPLILYSRDPNQLHDVYNMHIYYIIQLILYTPCTHVMHMYIYTYVIIWMNSFTSLSLFLNKWRGYWATQLTIKINNNMCIKHYTHWDQHTVGVRVNNLSSAVVFCSPPPREEDFPNCKLPHPPLCSEPRRE